MIHLPNIREVRVYAHSITEHGFVVNVNDAYLLVILNKTPMRERGGFYLRLASC